MGELTGLSGFRDHMLGVLRDEWGVVDGADPPAPARRAPAKAAPIAGTPEADDLIGSGDDDLIRGAAGDDRLAGLAGRDRLIGGGGDDTLIGGAGKDTLSGGGQDDRLVGGAKNDRLIGGGGADTLIGGAGKDVLKGGGGKDVLKGGGGGDKLNGGGGKDRLIGGGGKDELLGKGGADFLNGGGGADTLTGGKGGDRMKGGGGADVFVFTTADLGGVDRILDFGRGADRIDLSGVSGIGSFADLRFGALGGDLTIELDGGRIRLDKFASAGELSAGDFIFARASASDGSGDDRRVGGPGADVLPTGAGSDTLVGGAGGDVFDIRLVGGAIDPDFDVVEDFSYLLGDKVGVGAALAGIDYNDLSEVVRATPSGGDTFIAVNRGGGFVNALKLDGVSFTTADLAAYGFDAADRSSDGFEDNPYGFTNANAVVADPDATRDGRFVAWADQTSVDGAADDIDVIDGSTEFQADLDIFVRNTATGGTIRASVDGAGNTLKLTNGDGADSHSPSLSADGRWIAFATDGRGVATDLNDDGDVYLRDLFNDGAPILISVRPDGAAGGGVEQPDFAADSISVVAMSANGRRIAFVTSADLTGAGQTDANGGDDVYLRDLDAGTTTLISGFAANPNFAGGVFQPYSGLGDIVKISDDGRYVAFLSEFSLVGGDGNGVADVHIKDTATGALLNVTGVAAGGAFGFDMSADGARIVFMTESGLDADDGNGLRDAYVADINLGAFSVSGVFRVSEAPGGFEIRDERSESAAISPDGNRVAWFTAAEDVMLFNPASPADFQDRTYIRDLSTGTVTTTAGPAAPNSFRDSEHIDFFDDGFVYRKTVPALPGGARPTAETLATDGTQAFVTPADVANAGAGAPQIGGATSLRSVIGSAADVDVFRFVNGAAFGSNFRVDVEGADNNGGSLSAPSLAFYFNVYDGTPDFISTPNGGGDDDHSAFFFAGSGGTVFIEVGGVGAATGTYQLDVDFV